MTALFSIYFFYLLSHDKLIFDHIGTYIIEKHVNHYQTQYDTANQKLTKGHLNAPIELLNQWEGFKKGDRIYPLKREMLLNLSKNLYELKSYEKLMYWTQKWITLDERDVTAMAFYYEAQRQAPETHEQGIKNLINTYKKFPKNKFLKKFHTLAISEKNQPLI